MKSVPAALLVALVSLGGTASALPYQEVGDAGNTSSPQDTVGVGNLTEIHGTLGNPGQQGDTADAFWFGYGGAPGVLSISAAFDDPLLGVIAALLVDEAGAVLDGGDDGLPIVTDLPAGRYIVEVLIDDDGPDPPYTILLSGPELGPAGVLFAVPEPGSLALAAALLALLKLAANRVDRDASDR